MFIGVLQFELFIHGASSIKDKRSVVASLKARLHREHLVSVAEIGMLDSMHVARLAVALVGSDGRHIGQTLDRITSKLRALGGEAELGEVHREIIAPGNGIDDSTAIEGGGNGVSASPSQLSSFETTSKSSHASIDLDQLAYELLSQFEETDPPPSTSPPPP